MKYKELRKANNLTQKEIAKQINVAQTTYNGYELEQCEPTIETLKKLADYYNVSLDYLCDHKTKGLSDYGFLTEEQKTAIDILLHLPDNKFYEFAGRLKTIADLLEINYKGD